MDPDPSTPPGASRPRSSFARGLSAASRRARDAARLVRFAGVHRKYRDHTLLTREGYVLNLLLTDRVAGVPGCVVECGVWRGGMIAGIADVLGPSRRYYLFDSFQGLPPAGAADGPAAAAWQGTSDNCRAEARFAEEAMRRSRARDYSVVPGWFSETVPAFRPADPIALLRLDGDWYESTLVCLRHLFPRMAPGGLVVVDDYYTWDGCAKAVHRFLADEDLPCRVQQAFGKICIFTHP